MVILQSKRQNKNLSSLLSISAIKVVLSELRFGEARSIRGRGRRKSSGKISPNSPSLFKELLIQDNPV
jgi:hypothetical protein